MAVTLCSDAAWISWRRGHSQASDTIPLAAAHSSSHSHIPTPSDSAAFPAVSACLRKYGRDLEPLCFAERCE